jgi:hypothetical protein
MHATKFSSLVRARSVPDTPTNVERLFRIADAIKFPREELFL